MIVVSDAGPLIALARINKLDLLKHLFNKIFISKETYNELVVRGKGKAGSKQIKNVDWIKVKLVKDESSVNILMIDLDKGEAESIVLGQEINTNFLLIDELIARNIAEALGLKVVGTIGILLKAKREKLIAQIKPSLDELRDKKIWISDELYNKCLIMSDEL